MATWVGVIVASNGRQDLWTELEPLGVHGEGPVGAHVLVDCGARFGAVEELGRVIARQLATETIAFIVQTVSDAHAIYVRKGDAAIRTLQYIGDEGVWTKTGEPQPWEPAYLAPGDPPRSTENIMALLDALGVPGELRKAIYKPPGLLRRLFRR